MTTRTAILLAALAVAPDARAQPTAADPAADPIGLYLADLERSRRLPPEAASLETLGVAVRAAEQRLIHRDARAATTLLFGVVESPRYRPWKETPTFQNAEFLLGRALLRGGAHLSAERYLLRVLAHGPEAPYFVPAHRALVDLALETRSYQRLALLLAGRAGAPAVPRDSQNELEYLRGRAAYDAKELSAAADRFAAVERSSRLYPAAAYFRGLVAARRRQFVEARAAFCEIVDRKGGSKLAFNVDARYFGLQDLAHLALGRVAHEQDRYDEAYYFYFSMPEESERLAEALFEASWSMYQKGETASARAFVDQFERLFPRSPLRAEVAILRANLDLKACAFDRARAAVGEVVGTFGPLADQAAQVRASPARRDALVDRLLAQPTTLGPTRDADGELLALLKLDDRFRSLDELLKALDLDIAEATASVALWRALGDQAWSRKAVAEAPTSAEAAQLLEDVSALASSGTEDRALAQRLSSLLLDTSLFVFPPAAAGPYQREAREAEELTRHLTALRGKVTDAARAMAGAALADLEERLRAVLRQSRLVAIDAAVGKKKRLQLEISRLYAGKLPASLFHKLQAEGALADDEEYWPFEGEHWADEYYDFK